MLRTIMFIALTCAAVPANAVEWGHPNHLHGRDSIVLDAGSHEVTCQKITRQNPLGHVTTTVTLSERSEVTCYHGKLTIEPVTA
jgi:hypothetical protein